jgi:hypothetical protein
MTAQILPFRKKRLKDFADQRAAEIDAQVRRHFAEAFRYDRDAGALHIWLTDDPDRRGLVVLPFNIETQERVYL